MKISVACMLEMDNQWKALLFLWCVSGGTLSPTLRRVMDPSTHSFIPAESDSALPPIVSRLQGEVTYSDWESPINLDQPPLKFALNRNLFVVVKRVLREFSLL